jgi:hypothetical protein
MTRIPFARVFWLGAAGIVVLAAIVGVGAIVGGDFSDTDARILITLAALLYAGGAGLAGLALADRGPARQLGLFVAAAAPVGLVLMLWAIWGFVDEGDNEPQVKLAWTAVVTLVACLIATTSLLLARGQSLVRLSVAAGALAGLAAALSDLGIWSGDSDSGFLKGIAVLWILAGVAYFLVPILGRFASTAPGEPSVRVLAELDGVELVAVHSGNGLDIRLAPGERLQLRRHV